MLWVMFKSYKLYVGLKIDTRSPLIGQSLKGRVGGGPGGLLDSFHAGLISIFSPLFYLQL